MTVYLLDLTPGEVGLSKEEGTASLSDRQGEGDSPRDIPPKLPVLKLEYEFVIIHT